jgi:arsenate reductase (thioredoxin)
VKTWFCLAIATMLIGVPLIHLGAQQAAPHSAKPVLFVCEHGTVRSLLAKVLFEEYAAEVGLDTKAVSRGTRADSVVPPWMQQGLAADHVALGSWRPETLRPDDLTNASFVVSFDIPIAATAGARVPQAHWDSLPSVSKDYATGRDAIKVRVHQLVDSLQRASKMGRP